jgi:FixJ family two-component response regulator
MGAVAKSAGSGPGPSGPNPNPKARPRVLVVDDEPALVELVAEVVSTMNPEIRVLTAATLAEAEKVLNSQDVQVLVTDVHLPDGDGTALLPILRSRQPTARAIVITGKPTVDKAVVAIRGGAVDFVSKPFSNDVLAERVAGALAQSAQAAREWRKFERLRSAVKKLNQSRRVISKKVDLLCNDLVSAYGELSKQVEAVRTQEAFRKVTAEAGDLEQLLCHAMDWMLRQIGYSNVAVWLAGEDGVFQLGAYMRYTIAGDPPVIELIKRDLLPAAVGDGRDGLLRIKPAELAARLAPKDRPLLKNQDVLVAHCTYLGESLAALVFFRDGDVPFGEDDENVLKAIGPIFALALAGIVRDEADDEEEEGTDGRERRDDGTKDGPGAGPQDKQQPRNKDKRDAADWWKRGEPPPF